MGPRRILVVVDRRLRRTPALERAAELAERTGADLHLCLFDPAVSIEASFVWLAEQVVGLRASGIAARSEFVPAAESPRALLAMALKHDADLVVRDLHEDRELTWLEFNPGEKALMEHCPAPLLLVRAGSTGLPSRILAAVATGADGDAVGEAVAGIAAGFGAALGAEAHLAHVFRHVPPLGEGYTIVREAQAEECAAFERFAQHFGYPAGRRHWTEGRTADAVAALVNGLGAGWLVMGTQHHSLLGELWNEIAGSDTEHMVAYTRCDLLFVKPAGFLADLGRRLDLGAVCREHGVAWRQAA